MGVIKEAVQVLVDIGLLDVILPFILVFSITWSLLERSQVLGENGSRYNSIVAFVLGFIAVAALQVVTAISTIMQWSALFIILISFAVVFAKFMGGDLSGPNLPKIISLMIISIVALYALGISDWLSIDFLEQYVLPLLLVFLAIGGIAYLVMKPSSANTGSTTGSSSTPPSKAPGSKGSTSTPSRDVPEQGPNPPLLPNHPSTRYIGRAKDLEKAREL